MKFDTSQYNSASDIKGNPRPEPGRYLAVVKDCEWASGTTKAGKPFHNLKVRFEVQGGTCPGQRGREVTESFFLDDEGNPQSQLVRLAVVTGLIPPRTVVEEEPDWQRMIGVPLVIGLQQKGEYVNIGERGHETWPPNDPEVADVMAIPDCREWLVFVQRQAAPAAPAPQQTGQQPPQQPPATNGGPPVQQQTAQQPTAAQPAAQTAPAASGWGSI